MCGDSLGERFLLTQDRDDAGHDSDRQRHGAAEQVTAGYKHGGEYAENVGRREHAQHDRVSMGLAPVAVSR